MAKEVAAFIRRSDQRWCRESFASGGSRSGFQGCERYGFLPSEFNARTQDKAGKVLPVIITVYSDKSFDFIIKQPPVAVQLKEAAKLQSGSAEPNRKKVGKVTWDQIKEIAQDKMADMNCFTVEAAMRMVAGTARSMGIDVVGEFPN